MVKVRWTEFADVVRRFDDALVIFRGYIIMTYARKANGYRRAKSYARGWNSVTRDAGKYSSGGGKRVEK